MCSSASPAARLRHVDEASRGDSKRRIVSTPARPTNRSACDRSCPPEGGASLRLVIPRERFSSLGSGSFPSGREIPAGLSRNVSSHRARPSFTTPRLPAHDTKPISSALGWRAGVAVPVTVIGTSHRLAMLPSTRCYYPPQPGHFGRRGMNQTLSIRQGSEGCFQARTHEEVLLPARHLAACSHRGDANANANAARDTTLSNEGACGAQVHPGHASRPDPRQGVSHHGRDAGKKRPYPRTEQRKLD